MLHIVFEYKDAYSKGRWLKQECTCSSIKQCIEFYNLGIDCEYRIVSVEEVND